jgi:hypothetical protein
MVDCALQNTHIKQLMRTARHQRVVQPVKVHSVTCDMYNHETQDLVREWDADVADFPPTGKLVACRRVTIDQV